MTSIKDAATQAESVWLDLAGSVKKVIDLTAEAAGKGARIIAFSEVWLAGYPAWIGYVVYTVYIRTHHRGS